MMIRVRYPDGETRMVRPPLLDHLIRTRKIVEFQRQDGWARLGIDPVRTGRSSYQGPERRQNTLL